MTDEERKAVYDETSKQYLILKTLLGCSILSWTAKTASLFWKLLKTH